MPSHARTFSANGAVAARHQPYIAPAPLVESGVWTGYDHIGRLYFIDSSKNRKRGHYGAKIISLEAPFGHGKSVFAGSLTLRSAGSQVGFKPGAAECELRYRKVVNFGRKHVDGSAEIKPAMDYLLAEVVDLSQIGAVNIINFGNASLPEEVTRSCIAVQTDAKKAELDPIEVMVTTVASYYMVKHFPENVGIPQLERLMKDFSGDHVAYWEWETDQEFRAKYIGDATRNAVSDKGTVAVAGLSSSNLLDPGVMATMRQAALRCAGYLNDLLRSGRFGSLLSGTRSMAELMTEDIITFDLTNLPPEAADLFEAMWYRWVQTAEAAGLGYLLPDLHISEEQATAMQSLTHAMYMAEAWRKSRSLQTEWLVTSQLGGDYRTVGEPGSALRKNGMDIDKLITRRLYGKQPADDEETLHRIAQRGISDADVWRMTQLEVGSWASHIVGKPIEWFTHELMPSEVPILTRSDSANDRVSQRVFVYDLPTVQARIAALRELVEQDAPQDN